MPWLVVTGNGSWGVVLGKKWIEPENELAQGRWEYDAPTFKAGKHHVSERVREIALAEGYPEWVIITDDDDEPTLRKPDDTGVLTPEDVRYGNIQGVHVLGPDDPPEDVPIIDPEGLPLDFACPTCEDDAPRYPSEGARDRHIEFAHTRRHEVLQKRAEREAARVQAEREEHARLADAAADDAPLPAWEREAAEQKPPAPVPYPSPEG